MAINPSGGDHLSEFKRPDNIDKTKKMIAEYGGWTVSKGGDTLETVLFNLEGNPCFFKFTIVEEVTGETLYESQPVPPGKRISPVKLPKIFNDVGPHALVLKFQSVV
ncbi:hypothetical protein [Eubacterium aggregans]|uniref:hypothetical protein n=1 Tax=Eubacterium aggregans TaxID=81409 RepID=UPI003F2B6689